MHTDKMATTGCCKFIWKSYQIVNHRSGNEWKKYTKQQSHEHRTYRHKNLRHPWEMKVIFTLTRSTMYLNNHNIWTHTLLLDFFNKYFHLSFFIFTRERTPRQSHGKWRHRNCCPLPYIPLICVHVYTTCVCSYQKSPVELYVQERRKKIFTHPQFSTAFLTLSIWILTLSRPFSRT